MTADPAGHQLEIALPEYEVQILDRRGLSRTRDGFAPAHDPRQVVNRLDIGVSLPIPRDGRAMVETMLRELGRHDGSTIDDYSYATLGWLLDPHTGKHVYLAPAGSVAAEGPQPAFSVIGPAGSEAGSLNAASRG